MLLKVKDLQLDLDNKQVLNGINLELRSGEVYCLVGRNGTGKTTLAHVLIGMYEPNTGSILFNGESVNKKSISERAKLGITLAWQHPVTIEGLTVKNYIKLSNPELKDDDVKGLINTVGLECEEYKNRVLDDTLSGGERKRVELASVMAMNTKLVILDEPDSGIDVLSLTLITNLVRKLKEQGKSVLLITHRDELVRVSDRAGIICNGRIIKSGEPGKIYEYYKKSCDVCEAVNKPRESEIE